MVKKYIVRLSEEERGLLGDIVKKLKGTSQKVRRANILLKANVDGLDAVLNRKKRETPPRPKILDGKQEAEIIALRLGKPPAGFANWSLRLLAERIVELEIVDSISHATVRQTLKKTA